MKTIALSNARKDLSWFQKHNKQLYIKCLDLIRDIAKDPYSGLGKPSVQDKKWQHFESVQNVTLDTGIGTHG